MQRVKNHPLVPDNIIVRGFIIDSTTGAHAVKAGIKTEVVSLLVTKQWSPRQISGRLALEGKYISHETIYKMIRGDKANGGTLYKNCRHHLKHRRRPVGDAA